MRKQRSRFKTIMTHRDALRGNLPYTPLVFRAAQATSMFGSQFGIAMLTVHISMFLRYA